MELELSVNGRGQFGAEKLFLRQEVFLLKDFFLSALGAAALLTSDLFNSLSFSADPARLDTLNPIKKQTPG